MFVVIEQASLDTAALWLLSFGAALDVLAACDVRAVCLTTTARLGHASSK